MGNRICVGTVSTMVLPTRLSRSWPKKLEKEEVTERELEGMKGEIYE